MNFQNSSSLADYQDDLFKRYEDGEDLSGELKQLTGNMWVKIAKHIAPSNLVVRQLCLIDLISFDYNYVKKIIKLVKLLSYGGKIWAEGYSYFLYTKPFLVAHADNFNVEELKELIKSIEFGFRDTAYTRGEKLYPVPFGDLRDVDLEDHLQGKEQEHCHIFPVFKTMSLYRIEGKPVGLNTHIPKTACEMKIESGIPVGFTWYTGYRDKYSSKKEEILDYLSPKRWISIIKCL